MKAVAIVQARMGSTRFPGKVMQRLGGMTLVESTVKRLMGAQSIKDVIVATTDLEEDDVLARHIAALGFEVHRGSPTDVLGRFASAVSWSGLETLAIVRATADCPLISPSVVDSVVALYSACPSVAYASNVHPPTWPDGFDVEVMMGWTLVEASEFAKLPSEREHVTPWIWKRGKTANLGNPVGDMSSMRLTVDHPDDLDFLERLSHECDISRDLTCSQISAAVARIADQRAHARNEGYMSSVSTDGVSRES
jgi:spore coat polysaccharide biosynthesis protein SpsF (cytidylyltransferase family)